jgi:MSHA biogenesis protein MshQ
VNGLRATSKRLRVRAWLCAVLLYALGQSVVFAAPGDVLFQDDFSGTLSQWNVNRGVGDAGIGTQTSNSPPSSMYLRNGQVTVTSDTIDASVPAARLDVWIQRGSNGRFDAPPYDGEDLLVQYLNASNVWVTLETFSSTGAAGETFNRTYQLPADALHANLQIRFAMQDGSSWWCGYGYCTGYWHVDDVSVTEEAAASSGLTLGGCDDFESGLGNWTGTDSGRYGINTMTANSPTHSMYLRGGSGNSVTVTSVPIDLSSASMVNLTIWIRRGGSFSDYPGNNKDLVLRYKSSSGSWVSLETFSGGGTPGEVFNRTYALPADALYGGFQLSLEETQGAPNKDYWHVDDVCFMPSAPISYSFEESSWNGTSGEVKDNSSGGYDGTAVGGATTANTTPAIATNPGTCRYGSFNGNDYVEIPHNAAFDMPSEVTVAAWIRLRSLPPELYTIVSKDTNYEYHVNSSGQVYWWWNDSNGGQHTLTTSQALSLNQWYHVAITYTSGRQTIYVNGVPWATGNATGGLAQNALSLFIGTDWNFDSRDFDGFIDEVNVFPRALTQTEVQTLMNQTHDCGTTAPAFTISDDGYGINCVPEQLTVTVSDPAYNRQVTLDTQSGFGTWSLVSGGGALLDGGGNGTATYQWSAGDAQAVFQLYYPQGPPDIDVDVYQTSDPGLRDPAGEGVMSFAPYGFVMSGAPISALPAAPVPTQKAGAQFPVYVAAVGQTQNHPDCGVIDTYQGQKTLAFWSEYRDPSAGTRSVAVDGTAVAGSEAAAAVQNVSFANGQAMVTANYTDVGQIRLDAKDIATGAGNPDLPNGIRGGTGDFVVQPYRFELSNVASASGTANDPSVSGAGGPVFTAAGAPFSVTVTAVDLQGDPTPNYGKESTAETVRLQTSIVAPAGGVSPPIAFANGFGAFNGGSATGTDFSWPEVGIVALQPVVGDGDYLGSGGVTGSPAENVGRFIPDHFAATVNDPLFQTACAAGQFTYQGEPFGYLAGSEPVVTVEAEAVSGTRTQNYTGAFFKLGTSTLSNRTYASASGALDTSGLPPASADPAVAETAPGVGTLTFGSGTGLKFQRALAAPFQANIHLSIDVADADGVAAAGNPVTFGGASGIVFDAGADIRYGRMRLANALGSELVDLPVPAVVEQYDGPAVGFVPNSDDSCTQNVTLSLTGFTENLAAGATCALDSGAPGASGIGCGSPAPAASRFTEPPSAGNFNLNLQAPGAGYDGGATVQASVPAWLRYDWDQAAAGDENPSAQVTFGLYKGDSHEIYLSEIY